MNWYLDVLKQYAVFSGRVRRREYWMFVLFNGIVAMVALILDNILGITIGEMKLGYIYILFLLAVLIPSIAITVRRLHDVGKSGWMILIGLIPVVGTLWLLVLLAMEGSPGQNQFGQNPNFSIQENPTIEESEVGMYENDNTMEDTIILIVVIWMVLSRLFFAVAPKLAGTQYTSHWFDMVNTLIGLMWAFVPFGLAFAVKNRTKQLTLFILGGIYLFYNLYDVVFALLGK